MDQLVSNLQQLGLSEKESAVYLSVLEFGPAPIQEISHHANVNRATTYLMIESLAARGLISTCVRGKKRLYLPEEPDRLRALLELQQKDLANKLEGFDGMFPLLAALFHREACAPKIRYLEGWEGIKTARALFERMGGEFVEVVPLDDVHQTTELLMDREAHHARLRQQQTLYRVIAVVKDPQMVSLPEMGKGEWKLLSFKDFPIHANMVVRENHVFLFTYHPTVFSVIVVSQEIADMIRVLFDLAWKGAGEFVY